MKQRVLALKGMLADARRLPLLQKAGAAEVLIEVATEVLGDMADEIVDLRERVRRLEGSCCGE